MTPKQQYRKILEAEKRIVPVSDLKPSPYNPRDITPEARHSLKKSIDKFGLAGDIVWNEQTGHIVSGHQRFDILKEQGYEAISVIVLNLSPENEKALCIHLNNKAAQGHFTSGVESLIEEIRSSRPDLFDDLRLFDVKSEINYLDKDGKKANDKLEQEKTLRELEIRPFEHWDYIIFMFDNQTDWLNACSKLNIEHLNVSPSPQHQKIGIGRVIKGSRLVKLLERIDEKSISEVME